jgi:hypothetical protein
VSPKTIAVAGLSAIAIAASGCGGDSDREAELSAAFKKRFGEAPWYHHVTGVKMSSENSNYLEVTTDLGAGSNTLMGAICRAAYGFAKQEVGDRIEAVAMISSDGKEGGCA